MDTHGQITTPLMRWLNVKPLQSLHVHGMWVYGEDLQPVGENIFELDQMPGEKREQECQITPSIKALISMSEDGASVTLNETGAEEFTYHQSSWYESFFR
jgi:hypothetical protein